MITFILGFLCWPFIGFTYVLAYNCYIVFQKGSIHLYKNILEGLMGPIIIIMDFYWQFKYRNRF